MFLNHVIVEALVPRIGYGLYCMYLCIRTLNFVFRKSFTKIMSEEYSIQVTYHLISGP